MSKPRTKAKNTLVIAPRRAGKTTAVRRKLTLEDLARPHEPREPAGSSIALASAAAPVAEHSQASTADVAAAVNTAQEALDEITAPAGTADRRVVHPPKYFRGGIECQDAAEAMMTEWAPQTGYRLGQAFQYLYRHDHGGDPVGDLNKAQQWIQREIDARLGKLRRYDGEAA